MCEVHVTKSHAYLNNHDNSTFLCLISANAKFFPDIHVLLQYRCSKTVSTKNGIEIKTTEKSFEFVYFHFNYV